MIKNPTTVYTTELAPRTFLDLKVGDTIATPFGYQALVTGKVTRGADIFIASRVLVKSGADVADLNLVDFSMGSARTITKVQTGFKTVEIV